MELNPASAEQSLVVVIGGGTMGSGIAQRFLEIGCSVHLVERDHETIITATDRIVAGLNRRYACDASGRVNSTIQRLTSGVGLGKSSVDATLVIESVPESYEFKIEVLTEASEQNHDVLLATNTSGLSIDRLGEAVANPGRFLGMHFFNPVPKSALVELIRGRETRRDCLQVARHWVESLGMGCIEVADTPGFATSRLGIAIGLEAMRMLEEGVASAEDIDTGMVLGYKFPIGPLALTDMVGLDVRLAIADHLYRELGVRFAAPQILRDHVAVGRLGRKVGCGFYEW